MMVKTPKQLSRVSEGKKLHGNRDAMIDNGINLHFEEDGEY